MQKELPSFGLMSKKIEDKSNQYTEPLIIKEKLLCKYCKRTAYNNIHCLGICVEESGY